MPSPRQITWDQLQGYLSYKTQLKKTDRILNLVPWSQINLELTQPSGTNLRKHGLTDFRARVFVSLKWPRYPCRSIHIGNARTVAANCTRRLLPKLCPSRLTVLKLKFCLRGTDPSTFQKKWARSHQIGKTKSTATELYCCPSSRACRQKS